MILQRTMAVLALTALAFSTGVGCSSSPEVKVIQAAKTADVAHRDPVSAVVYSPSGKQLATASWDKTVKIWSVDNGRGKVMHALKGHQRRVLAVAFHPEGKWLASAGADKTIRIWDWKQQKLHKTLEKHSREVTCLVFNQDGQLASGSRDGKVIVWDVEGGTLTKSYKHGKPVFAVAFSSNGRLLFSGGQGGMIKMWKMSTGKLVAETEGHTEPVRALDTATDAQHLVSGGDDKLVKVWHIEEDYLANEHTFYGHTGAVLSVGYSLDKKIVSASRDKTLRVWDPAQGGAIAVLKGHSHWVWGADFSLDAKFVASASNDKTVIIWNIIEKSVPPYVLIDR